VIHGDIFSTDAVTVPTLTRAVVRACAAPYTTNFANTSVCLDGFVKITDDTTCRAAAAAVGKPYGGSYFLPSFPSGCFLNIALTLVYLNTHPTGAAGANGQPLCKGIGAPFQPPPPHTPQGYRGWSTPRRVPR
jgi:hypothetical protein